MSVPGQTSENALSRVHDNKPVLIVGGGIAGLTAAWELKRRGVEVRLIESQPRVGGRIQTVGERGLVETGMQFYYSSYRRTKRLLREFGLESQLVPIHIRGLMYWQGQIASFDKNRPWLHLLTTRENLQLQMAVASKLVPLLRMSPFDYRKRDRLDRIDCAEYFTRTGNENIMEVAIRPMVNSYAFCEPEGHSLAMLLRIMKLGGLASTYGLLHGNDGLPKAMAKGLDVIFGKVTDVLVENGRVEGVVLDRDGRQETMAARAVICAVRAPQAARILTSLPEVSTAMSELSYSTVVLANLHLDRALEGDEWCYVMSRKDGHKASFGVDLTRRSPAMFPDGKSVIQVNLVSPFSEQILGAPDDAIVEQSIMDMESFLPQISDWITHTSVVRRPAAIPNFQCGMYRKIRTLQEHVASIDGLHLAGDYLRAPLCEGAVRSARQCVPRVMRAERRQTAQRRRSARRPAARMA